MHENARNKEGVKKSYSFICTSTADKAEQNFCTVGGRVSPSDSPKINLKCQDGPSGHNGNFLEEFRRLRA